MQDYIFPNLGIVRNMKPTDVFLHSISGKAYRLRQVEGKTRTCLFMSPYLIKAMRKFYVLTIFSIRNMSQHKLNLHIFCYQFDIYFYVGPIDEESPEDMEEEKTLTSYN